MNIETIEPLKNHMIKQMLNLVFPKLLSIKHFTERVFLRSIWVAESVECPNS